MYSLVLMATMATPATVPDCHWRRCSGCYGSCSGSYYGGCHGGCSGSCSGGCHGGYYRGCTGGCYGSAYYYGGSCFGGHTCYGCTGGCTGYVGGGYYGAAGQPMPGAMPAPAPAPAGGGAVAPAPAPGSAGGPPRGDASPSPAHIYVSLPADAKLYVDGQLTKTIDKANRSFQTPELEKGVEYRYVMKAEIVRDGQVQSETKTVLVRAGAVVQEEFGSLNTITTASNR